MNAFFEVKNVTFSSSKEHKLIDVNFCIKEQGQIISILGPSGVGKTTILRAIAGLDPITNGEIFLNKKITYIEMQNLLLRLIKNNKFTKYYNKYPKNINDIYAMADKVKKNLKEYEKNFK